MLTGRLLLMFVVMTATLATRQPAAHLSSSSPAEAVLPVERTTWVQRLGAGVTRSFSRIGLMQRVALRVPAPALNLSTGYSTRAVVAVAVDPLRTCLPPPMGV